MGVLATAACYNENAWEPDLYFLITDMEGLEEYCKEAQEFLKTSKAYGVKYFWYGVDVYKNLDEEALSEDDLQMLEDNHALDDFENIEALSDPQRGDYSILVVTKTDAYITWVPKHCNASYTYESGYVWNAPKESETELDAADK